MSGRPAATRPPAQACARVPAEPAAGPPPPSSDTGVENTQSAHWLAGHPSSSLGLDSVLGIISGKVGESVVVLDGGHNGYSVTYRIGAVAVLENPARPDMGTLVELTGRACEELGLQGVAELYRDLGMESVTRLDWAFDTSALTVGQVEAAWRANDVRTRVKVPDPKRLADKGYRVLPEYEGVRTCRVREEVSGRTFYMGSRQAQRFARVYDRRGFTRFEVVFKDMRASVVAAELLVAVLEAPELVPSLALGHLRDFVDFVDGSVAGNRSRAPLLAWWEVFVDGAGRAGLSLSGTAARTLDTVRAWFARQVAPSLALLVEAFGWEDVRRMSREGRERWSVRHQLLRRAGSLSAQSNV